MKYLLYNDAAPVDSPKMQWLFGENPDIHTLDNYLPGREEKALKNP